MKVSRSTRRRLVAVGFAGIVAITGAAFAASNTVADSNAGQGSSTVSGFTVTAVGYVEDVGNEDTAAAVYFNIARVGSVVAVADANATVYVSVDGGTSFEVCTVTAGAAQCALSPAVTFSSITSVGVIAYDIP